MKRIIVCSALCLTLGLSAPARAQRCIPGQIGVELTAGTLDGFLFRNPYAARRFSCGGRKPIQRGQNPLGFRDRLSAKGLHLQKHQSA